jgi:hypothetical protein
MEEEHVSLWMSLLSHVCKKLGMWADVYQTAHHYKTELFTVIAVITSDPA